MNNTQLLKYGFVLELDGEVVYDHMVRARIPYADALIRKLSTQSYPVIASRCQVVNEEGLKSPVFKYASMGNTLETFQSAYYLADALTRKNILPIYFADTGEVKDLMPILDHEQKKDAAVVIHILRARYIKPEIRHPQKGFLQASAEESAVDSEMIAISDEDILKIFGRLPKVQSKVADESVAKGNNQSSVSYISDSVAQLAS